MEFKGTKGKWVFDNLDFKIKGSGDIEGRTVVANVSPKMDYSRGKTTQSYNALLISKAPDMLKMLQRIEAILNYETIEPNSPLQLEIFLLIKEATEL